jgi:hypothetical protein
MRSVLSLVILCAAANGCTGSSGDELVRSEAIRAKWLGWINAGVTTRGEVRQKLGDATSTYEGGRIEGYRLILADRETELTPEEYRQASMNSTQAGLFPDDTVPGQRNKARRKQVMDKGVLFVVRREDESSKRRRLIFRDGEYGLVLVYRSDGVIARDALVRVLP